MGVKLVALDEPWARRQYAICMLSLDELDVPSRRLIDFLTRQERKENAPGAALKAAEGTARRR
jgi:hypothetical protein